MKKKIFIITLALVFCITMCIESLCEDNKNEKAIYDVVDKYLDGLTGPTTGTMEQAVDAMNNFASLFDFENLKSSKSVPILDTMSYQYKQLKDKEQKDAFNLVFAGNFVPSFQKARLNRVGQVAREDFVIEDIKVSESSKEATVAVKDKKKISNYTLFLHDKKGEWLIYSWEVKPAPK